MVFSTLYYIALSASIFCLCVRTVFFCLDAYDMFMTFIDLTDTFNIVVDLTGYLTIAGVNNGF